MQKRQISPQREQHAGALPDQVAHCTGFDTNVKRFRDE
jgi:hypothetical protein